MMHALDWTPTLANITGIQTVRLLASNVRLLAPSAGRTDERGLKLSGKWPSIARNASSGGPLFHSRHPMECGVSKSRPKPDVASVDSYLFALGVDQ